MTQYAYLTPMTQFQLFKDIMQLLFQWYFYNANLSTVIQSTLNHLSETRVKDMKDIQDSLQFSFCICYLRDFSYLPPSRYFEEIKISESND